MVTIRLAKFGRKKGAFFRVVVVDSIKKVAGKNIEVLGHWNPAKKDFVINMDKVDKWLKNGAQISTTVKKLIANKAK